MNLIGLLIENIRRIRTADVTFPPNGIVQVVGSNESGKSTFLNAVKWTLAGKSAIPEHVITEGERNGRIVMEIGVGTEKHYNVELRLYKSGDSRLTVTAADGSSIKSQQALLNTFWNDVSIQPLAFANASPKQQREMLLAAMKLPIRDEFKRLTGKSTSDSPIDDLDQVRKTAYDERTIANREVKRLTNQLSMYEDVQDIDVQNVDVSELIAERDVILEEERLYNNNVSELRNIRERMEQLYNEIAQLAERSSALEAVIGAYSDNSERLRYIEDIIANAAGMKRVEEKRRIQEELNEAQRLAEEHDKVINAVDEEKRWMVENSKLPLPELSFADGVVLYDGEPLEARGISRRLLIGCAVGKALNPLLNCVLIDEGSEIDPDTMEELRQWAIENDVLIVMAREMASGDNAVFTIEDGVVKEVEND